MAGILMVIGHASSVRALAAMPQDTRSEIFGQLLATCAHCHAARARAAAAPLVS
jgi:cytochrome c553